MSGAGDLIRAWPYPARGAGVGAPWIGMYSPSSRRLPALPCRRGSLGWRPGWSVHVVPLPVTIPKRT